MTSDPSPPARDDADRTHAISQVRVLASGSKGNAFFVRNGDAQLLIDAGISCRRLVRGLREIEVEPASLDAVLITHEHRDHVNGLPIFCKRFPNIPVYTTRGTAMACLKRDNWQLGYREIWPDQAFAVKHLMITPVSVSHDANDPVAFRVEAADFALGLATDLGYWSDELLFALDDCQVLILESNYDRDTLYDGPYPYHLKRRIASRTGHLSNAQAYHLLRRLQSPRLEHVVLAHLSEENNAPALAYDAVAPALDGRDVTLTVAAQRPSGPLLTFTASAPAGRERARRRRTTARRARAAAPSAKQGWLPFFEAG